MDPSKKVPDLKCEVPDLLLKVVDLKQEVSDLRSGGIPLNLTPAFTAVCPPNSEKHVFEVCQWSEVSVFRLIWKTATKTEVGRTDLSNCVTSAASDRTGRQSMTDTDTWRWIRRWHTGMADRRRGWVSCVRWASRQSWVERCTHRSYTGVVGTARGVPHDAARWTACTQCTYTSRTCSDVHASLNRASLHTHTPPPAEHCTGWLHLPHQNGTSKI